MWKEIKTYGDLPQYGKNVIVLGVDDKMYNSENTHICYMDDLEDGIEFTTNGTFYWLTESGREIKKVKYWCEIPKFIHPNIQSRIDKINKIKTCLK